MACCHRMQAMLGYPMELWTACCHRMQAKPECPMEPSSVRFSLERLLASISAWMQAAASHEATNWVTNWATRASTMAERLAWMQAYSAWMQAASQAAQLLGQERLPVVAHVFLVVPICPSMPLELPSACMLTSA